jgi:hypothetical protein
VIIFNSIHSTIPFQLSRIPYTYHRRKKKERGKKGRKTKEQCLISSGVLSKQPKTTTATTGYEWESRAAFNCSNQALLLASLVLITV